MKTTLRIYLIMYIMALMPVCIDAQTTLAECQEAALRNYPLIKKYELIHQSTDYTLDNISKGWLPQISAVAQATLQSDVTTLPESFRNVMSATGQSVEGLKKDQYRIGVDINQMLYDGGRIKKRKDVAFLQGAVQSTQNEVDMYTVRRRINELYFGILLIDSRIEINRELQQLLSSNEEKLASMLKNGIATESDVNSVKAEILGASQQMTELKAAKESMQRMLAAFCGMDNIGNLMMPDDVYIPETNNRPELRLIDDNLKLVDAQEKLLKSQLIPNISIFAQGFYGYPGYDMFSDIMKRNWSLNGIIGARITWNISNLYTYKNDKEKLRLQREQAENNRDVFLFNNNMETISHREEIKKYRSLIKEDEKMIGLRSSVRLSAESKLKHGIIDVNNLVQEINRENNAKIQKSIHETELLKYVYDLKYILGIM